MPDVLVALVHQGRVLAPEGDRLPELAVDDVDESDDWFQEALDLVGADVYLAPVLKPGPGQRLAVVGCRSLPVPAGRWVSPEQLPGEVGALVARSVHEHEQVPPPLRPAWFRPGWYDEVERWVDTALERVGRGRTGTPRVGRVWGISAVLRVPTAEGDLWFKAAAQVFRQEAAIHRVVATHFPDDVPVLVAEDDARAWLLMEELAGAGDGSRRPGAARVLAPRWAEVQLASQGLLGELRQAGAMVRDADRTVAGFRRVLEESRDVPALDPADRSALHAVTDEAEGMVHALWDCGLPDTLVHGDLHVGNVAYDGQQLRVFDWTDGCVSHPFLDGCHLARFDDRKEPDHALMASYAEPWRREFPAARVDDAIRLAPVVNLLFQVDTFHRIELATEPASGYELGGVVAWLLRRLPGAVAEARNG